MNYRSFLPFLCITVLKLVSPAVAQDETPTDRLMSDMGRYCNRATEVSYRSQAIESPDSTRRVRFEGTLRKILHPDSPSRSWETDDFCYGDIMETLSTEVVIDGQSDSFQLLDQPLRGTYLILNALALSADNRYLAAEADFIYGGLGHQSAVTFFDLETGESISPQEICVNEFETEYDHTSFEGFLSPTIAVVFCSIFDYRNTVRIERYEAVDLTSGASQVLLSKPDNLRSYGTIVSDLEVVQVQEFSF